MSSNRGFTLIEALVAMIVGALMVFLIGGLGERLMHHRSTADSNSAAMALAERHLETLLANPVPNPTCATPNSFALCAGTHTPINLNPSGGTTNPTYQVQWTIVDATSAATSPLVVPAAVSSRMKRITIVVRHLNNPQVNATLVRNFKAS